MLDEDQRTNEKTTQRENKETISVCEIMRGRIRGRMSCSQWIPSQEANTNVKDKIKEAMEQKREYGREKKSRLEGKMEDTRELTGQINERKKDGGM